MDLGRHPKLNPTPLYHHRHPPLSCLSIVFALSFFFYSRAPEQDRPRGLPQIVRFDPEGGERLRGVKEAGRGGEGEWEWAAGVVVLLLGMSMRCRVRTTNET